jgi:hypothetical protein
VGRRFALASCALAALLASPRDLLAQQAFPSREVRIFVSAGAGGTFSVTEQYALTRKLDDTSFEILGNACVEIGVPTARIDGDAFLFPSRSDARGPWTVFRAQPPPTFRGADDWFQLEYTVTPRGAHAVVPIAMPASTLESAPGLRGADVVLHVQIADAADRIVTPRLEPDSTPEIWVGRLLAIPSSVRIDLAAAGAACAAETPGTTGGLEWRFAIFAATMAVWVPLYLVWFGRRPD